MQIKHHPGPESLMSCSAGSMPEALAAVMASHIDVCAECRKNLALLDQVGAALFETLTPLPFVGQPPLMIMRAGEAGDKEDGMSAQDTTDVPRPLVSAVGRELDHVPWEDIAPGISHHQIELRDKNRGDLRLVRVAAGQMFVRRSSGNSNVILVLKGSYRDATGHYQIGDVVDYGEEVEYALKGDPIEGCICLIATDYRARK